MLDCSMHDRQKVQWLARERVAGRWAGLGVAGGSMEQVTRERGLFQISAAPSVQQLTGKSASPAVHPQNADATSSLRLVSDRRPFCTLWQRSAQGSAEPSVHAHRIRPARGVTATSFEEPCTVY